MVRGSNESLELAGIFSTYPNAHISVGRLPVETVIAAILMCLIPALTDDGNGIPRGPLAPLLIGILIAVIGASMGPLTGFALNPARDFGPKLFAYGRLGQSRLHRRTRHPVLPGADLRPYRRLWPGAFGYRALIGRHLPCDVCVTEEEPDAKTQQRKA